MALNPLYILQMDLETLLVDRNTGLPLANGTIEFWEDDARNTPKDVYELTGAPPNYQYTALANPLPLSIIGTPNGSVQNNVAIYYFPYDAFGNAQLYYIVVKDSSGNVQFTREAWPNTPIGGISPSTSAVNSPTNLITNSQFVDVFFDPTQNLVINVAGATDVPFAPGWNLRANGAGTVTISRTAITGTQQYSTNPPYTLTLLPGGVLTQYEIYQRLTNNTNIWAARTDGSQGYVASSISFGTNFSTVTMRYVPSDGGTAQQLLNATNNSGLFTTYNDTVQLIPPNNADNSNAGYVDIVIQPGLGGPTSISSVQVIGMATDEQNVAYDQEPVNRQKDYLSHYYNPLNAYKPIPSYLVGWDFPKNPAQIYGDVRPAQAIGANRSQYVWDQTIVFQTANSGAGFARDGNGGFQITAVNAIGQVAVIQYLDQIEARKILSDRISVHISGSTNRALGIVGKVSLYYTLDVNLPNCATGTNLSIVAGLDATGKPNAFNGNWLEVPRSGLGDAYFALDLPSATNSESADINLNMWDLAGAGGATAATFFAIVIGFEPLAIADQITFNSVGLCNGDIATRPAPKAIDATLRDCERYYEMSYVNFAAVGTITSVNALSAAMSSTIPAGGNSLLLPLNFGFEYRTLKRVVTPVLTVYSPVTGAVGNVNCFASGAFVNQFDSALAGNWVSTLGNKAAYFTETQVTLGGAFATNNATTPLRCSLSYQYIIDARLGIVN